MLVLILLVPLASSLPGNLAYNSHRPGAFVYSAHHASSPVIYRSKITYTGQPLAKNLARSSDFVEQTRTQANSLKNTLRSLASTPGAAKIVNKVINDSNNVCLNSLDEAIEAVETGTRIVENAGPDIKQLIQSVKAFEKITDTPTVIRESAKMLGLLEVLMPKLAPANVQVCKANNAQTFGSLRSLAVLVDELSSSNKITGLQTKEELKTSAKIISGATTFIIKLNKSFTKFDKLCSSDKEYNVEAITSIGEMMSGLADILGALGGISDAEDIRKQEDFTKRVVDNIMRLGNYDLGTLECNNSGSFKVAAQTLDDVAKLIEEVGLETLCTQLGVDLDCSFSG